MDNRNAELKGKRKADKSEAAKKSKKPKTVKPKASAATVTSGDDEKNSDYETCEEKNLNENSNEDSDEDSNGNNDDNSESESVDESDDEKEAGAIELPSTSNNAVYSTTKEVTKVPNIAVD